MSTYIRRSPPGTYFLTSLIVEYDASAINSGGWLPRAFFNYGVPRSPVTFEPPVPGATPQAGLWWDPDQIGTGYTITINHGVVVVAVYSYAPDGSPQWYLASGPLSTDGQVFSAVHPLHR